MAVLSNEEVDRRLRDLPGWRRDGEAIVRQFTFDGFTNGFEKHPPHQPTVEQSLRDQPNEPR